MKKKMTDDRRRQVETTRLRHGKDFYEKTGALSSGKGQTFKDPKKASEAAKLMWEKKRAKQREEEEKKWKKIANQINELSNISSS